MCYDEALCRTHRHGVSGVDTFRLFEKAVGIAAVVAVGVGRRMRRKEAEVSATQQAAVVERMVQ